MVIPQGEAVSNTTCSVPVKSLAPQLPEEDMVQEVIGQFVVSVLLKKASQVVKESDGAKVWDEMATSYSILTSETSDGAVKVLLH